MQILVVDDIEESRHALCELVRQLGHVPVQAHRGAAALEQVRRAQPDLVLLDLLMPDMDGFEVTQQLRTLCADRWLPVIVTSALQGDAHFIRALNNGADDYLSRPVDAGLLEAKLRHYNRVLSLQSRVLLLGQRQRDILNNLSDAVITLNPQGVVLEMNRRARFLFEAQGRQVLGASCLHVLGAAFEDLRQRREHRFTRADGSELMAELSWSEWQDSGRLHHTLVLRDLTERYQMERMKDEFLATVSHELRTPLTSVMGALGLLVAGAAGPMPDQAQKMLEMARRNGERLGRLVDDVLDLTKLEGRRMVLQLQPQSITSLLRESMSHMEGYAARAQVTLKTHGLNTHTDVMVRLDSHRFLQVMANLLSNAVKHSPKGESVVLSFTADDKKVRVNVRDRGPGISAQFRARLFTKFSQADGTDHRPMEGTGLGLYISRMLVEQMHGRISADEVEGSGASFTLQFPLAGTEDAPDLPLVLHIDHDYQIRERVSHWLGSGYEVHSAASLVTLSGVPSGRLPQLVIGNPQHQGSAEEFCRALQRLAGTRPVLLYSDSVNAAFARRMGCHWLRATTCTQEQWHQAIHQLLQS